MRRSVERILRIGGEYRVAQVIGKRIAVRQSGKAANQEVRQTVASGGAIESELAVILLVVDGIELVFARIHAKAELVPAADERKIVRYLVSVDVEKSGSAGTAAKV